MPRTLTAAELERLDAARRAHRLGDLQTAERGYRELLAGVPSCVDGLHLLGLLHVQRGDVEAGLELLRRVISIEPRHVHAHVNLAKALLDADDAAAALAAGERAVEIDPGSPEAWYNRGNALQRLQAAEQAAQSYERALRLRPEYPAALGNLGEVLRGLRRYEAALACLDGALELDPRCANAWNNRGLVLLDLRRTTEALASFDRALEVQPSFGAALNNRANALLDLRRHAEARDAFGALSVVAPGFMYVDGGRLQASLQCCEWSDYAPLSERVLRAVAQGERADHPFSFLCVSDAAELQLRCARTYTRDQFPPHPELEERRRFGHDRVRLAYVSGDFGDHAVSHLLAGVFETHDRTQFETVAISWGRRNEGAMRRRVEASFERFVDVSDQSDAQTAALMRSLEVDIAVDLSGHTRECRTGIFARRAAPVQVNYLGLPATMGASYMDYLIADRHLVPAESACHYAEKVVWMPDSFQPNDAGTGAPAHLGPASRATDFGLPENVIVLGSFNNCAKYNPPLFDIWMRVLQRAPDCVLWLLATEPGVQRNLRREAEARGIPGGRLVFAARAPREQYLARFAHLDLFLDSAPFNGGTTSSDALMTSTPLLTWTGRSFAGRMSTSLLNSLGMPQLVASSAADYEAKASTLARRPDELARLRRELAERRRHRFFDTSRYRRHLEAAFRTMWCRNEDGLAPAAFAVEPLPS